MKYIALIVIIASTLLYSGVVPASVMPSDHGDMGMVSSCDDGMCSDAAQDACAEHCLATAVSSYSDTYTIVQLFLFVLSVISFVVLYLAVRQYGRIPDSWYSPFYLFKTVQLIE